MDTEKKDILILAIESSCDEITFDDRCCQM